MIILWSLIAIILFSFLIGTITNKKIEEKEKKDKIFYNRNDLSINDTISFGDYVGGHPDIDNSNSLVSICCDSENLNIISRAITFLENRQTNKIIGTINLSSIVNVVVEDRTTFENRVTAGRILLLGLFAIAAPKKEQSGYAYVIIEWFRDGFKNTTFFQHKNISEANYSRNKLLRSLVSYNETSNKIKS